MQRLEWDEGMSVGVEAIDNDHKQLLALINEISDAIDRNKAPAVIEDVFAQLEAYVVEHFSREEALMRQCRYPDLKAHIKQHRQFTAKVPELKRELLNADSTEVAAEINLFLFDWLMNHIVGEDMCFAQLAHDSGLSTKKQRKPSRLRRMTAWLGNRLTLGRRIFLTALIPIVGVSLLSVLVLWISFQRFYHVQQLMGVTAIVQEINDLSHQLQKERGLSAGVISSEYAAFKPSLQSQRQQTDQAVTDFLDQLQGLPELDPLLATQIQITRQKLDELAGLRDQIDSGSLTVIQSLGYYSTLIDSLQKIPEGTLKLEMDSDLVNSMTAYTALLHMKEAAGVQRAIGTQAILQGEFSPGLYQRYASLIGEQRSFSKVFNQFVSPEQQKLWQAHIQGPAAIRMQGFESLIDRAIQEDRLAMLDSQRWFEVTSARIDGLKTLADQLGEVIDARATQQVSELKWGLVITTITLMIILSLTILLSWLLNRSVIDPVRRMTRAMTRLAEGERDLRFTDHFARDELGRMAAAYEECRRSLLRADVASTVSNHRQQVELQARIREKERFRVLASTDPLTGAVNRRKFTELAENEIERAERYKRPLSVMMLDLDHFKRVNDTYGHAAGDDVLRMFYQTCYGKVRSTDVVSRLGGEEFAILMPETDLKQALELAARIRYAISQLVVKVGTRDRVNTLTVSIGVTAWDVDQAQTISDMLEQADQALYYAKESGRDRVVGYDEHCQLETEKTRALDV
ncbi:bacteriohemerythrin [Pontibacterium sp.]|uniref:bacteriohemerythrin n=1 Tax=Pontibacterium sp. TaxID=2036026 RepID=UPI003514CBFA